MDGRPEQKLAVAKDKDWTQSVQDGFEPQTLRNQNFGYFKLTINTFIIFPDGTYLSFDIPLKYNFNSLKLLISI